MKNWKYIEGAKIGNETLAAHPDSAVAQEIYKIYLDNGKDKKKALETLSGKYKNIPSDALEKHLDDAIKAYAQMIKNKNVPNDDKTGAEEFFKQLSDDVKEREEKDDADIEKVGNLSKDELLKELDAEEKLLKVLEERGGEKGYGTNPILYRDAKRRIQDIKNKLKQIGNSKVGNESPDDKFAYVMREFDEGKLKTPDGKVVTDPAQAKAIAYSESKKTENGLARARKAIK